MTDTDYQSDYQCIMTLPVNIYTCTPSQPKKTKLTTIRYHYIVSHFLEMITQIHPLHHTHTGLYLVCNTNGYNDIHRNIP